MTTKCPIETLRDLVLAGETPRDSEVEAAMREAGAPGSRGTFLLTQVEIRDLVARLLEPQIQAISTNNLVQIPYLGKVN